MKTKSISIFGGGLAGCTLAHLLCKDYKVFLFEASNQIGGFVKTFRNEDNIPQEHSPRIVLNDYHLFERIFKDLGIEHNLISNPKNTVIPLQEESYSIQNFFKSSLTIYEIVLLSYYIILGFFSTDKELQYMDYISVYDIIQSKQARKWFDTISLVAGERPDKMPLYKLFRMTESNVYNIFRSNKTINGPWSEQFLNHWEKYLKQNGVIIHYNTPLKQFDKTINHAIIEIEGELKYISTDYFVLATDISNSIKIINKTNLENLKQNLNELHFKTKSEQMGMQLFFPNNIKTNLSGYFTLQSDWNPIIHIQSKQLWSLAIPDMTLYSKRLNKRVFECTEEEIKQEILYQLKLKFTLPVPKIYIWPSWKFINHRWKTTGPYFWNAVGTKHLRPKQKILDNLYIAGAYTDTNYYSYYMEGAIESGFMIAEQLLGKNLNIPKRRYPLVLKIGLILGFLFYFRRQLFH